VPRTSLSLIPFALTVSLVGAFAAVGCNTGDGNAEPCQEGRSVACTCPGGAEGGQVCRADGSWSACQCDGDAGLADADSDPTGGGSDTDTDQNHTEENDTDVTATDTGADADGDDDVDDADDTDGGDDGPPAFKWDQTHVDTQWLDDADDNDNLTIETVTNLDADGNGSLNDALSAAEDNANTLIVFEIGGVIDNGGRTYVRSRADNVYIAGQTAPYPGITLIRGGLRIHGDNTIVEHMTFLPGDDIDSPDKSRSITYDDTASHVMIDQCAAGWAPDTNVNFRKDHSNLAFINSINSEALNDSSHSEAPHGYGTLISENTSEITVMGNLMSHNWKRNPFDNEDDSEFVWLNNYVDNWGERHYHGSTSGGPDIDWIGNVSRQGPDTDLSEGIFEDNAPTVHYADNLLIPDDTPLEDDNVDYVDNPMNLPSGLSESDLLPPEKLEEFIVARIGPRPADRAPFAQRIIDDFKNEDGEIIDHHDDVGGYPDYDTETRDLDPPESDVLDWLQQYTDQVE